MHLAPESARSAELKTTIPPLPPNKTITDVFADFMKYLLQCAKLYITRSHPSGESFWPSVERDIIYILTHPNGWGGAQQTQMRTAAIKAGLVANESAGQERIHFVTEGEASLHFCIHNGLSSYASEVEYIVPDTFHDLTQD